MVGYVSPEEKAHMERLKKIMNGENVPLTTIKTSQTTNIKDPIILSTIPTAEQVDHMKKLMSIIGGSTNNPVSTLVENASQDNELRTALITEKVDNGIKVGAWVIKKILREGASGTEEQVYRIYNSVDNQTIKATFMIYESAQYIIKLLNTGHDLNNSKIKEIINLEIQYRTARDMALTEKDGYHRAKKNNNQHKMDLFEAKFDAAKHKALYLREIIRNKFHQLP